MIEIRPFTETDWFATWSVMEPVFRVGETYAVPIAITADEAHEIWVEKPRVTCVAVTESGDVLGTYYIKPNQSGPGAHVCNCGYIVAGHANGKGVASAMCEHSQHEAVALGFRAMQYNLVVASNERAVRLWQRQGFAIVGTLPGAFQHPRLGYVDAFVMYKELVT